MWQLICFAQPCFLWPRQAVPLPFGLSPVFLMHRNIYCRWRVRLVQERPGRVFVCPLPARLSTLSYPSPGFGTWHSSFRSGRLPFLFVCHYDVRRTRRLPTLVSELLIGCTACAALSSFVGFKETQRSICDSPLPPSLDKSCSLPPGVWKKQITKGERGQNPDR